MTDQEHAQNIKTAADTLAAAMDAAGRDGLYLDVTLKHNCTSTDGNGNAKYYDYYASARVTRVVSL